jgi:DNA-binding transcriptional MerR regulator
MWWSITVEISDFTVTDCTVTVKSDIVYPMPASTRTVTGTTVAGTTVTGDGDSTATEWTIDELAGLAGLPVRTIREYQNLAILPAPRREGRVGIYGASHLRRLQLIARMRDRGYSLAGIGDLLGSWSAGADLGEVLGLEPDQLVHLDEPGAPATFDQLRAVLPAMIPDHLAALEATGVLERCRPDRFCIPSPSLLQLAIDAQDAGLAPDDVVALLSAIQHAADTVADEVVHQLGRLPAGVDPTTATAFLQRGRGLLAHGVGRLTLHRIGRRLGITDEADVEPTVHRIVETRSDPT